MNHAPSPGTPQQNPRKIFPLLLILLVAILAIVGGIIVANIFLRFQVTALSSDDSLGTVEGSGTYWVWEDISITAKPKPGYIFLSWNDGNTNATRKITATGQNQSYAAIFIREFYEIETTCHGEGTISGGGSHSYNTEVTLKATPAQGYVFSSWSDGVATEERQITVTNDATYSAIFVLSKVTVTARANSDGGTVTGSGEYTYGTTVTLTATPKEGYVFTCWNDGNTSAKRTIAAHGRTTYTATFERAKKITVSVNNPDYGSVSGGGDHAIGSTITLKATPASGYKFVAWGDGNTNATRTLKVSDNERYTAFFARISPLSNYEAKIGSSYYATLNEAIRAARSGQTIEIQRDISESIATIFIENKSITIDGNGFTLPRSITFSNDQSINSLTLKNLFMRLMRQAEEHLLMVSGGNFSTITVQNCYLESSLAAIWQPNIINIPLLASTAPKNIIIHNSSIHSGRDVISTDKASCITVSNSDLHGRRCIHSTADYSPILIEDSNLSNRMDGILVFGGRRIIATLNNCQISSAKESFVWCGASAPNCEVFIAGENTKMSTKNLLTFVDGGGSCTLVVKGGKFDSPNISQHLAPGYTVTKEGNMYVVSPLN